MPNENILDELLTGRATAIGWGCGDVFRAARDTLHSFPLTQTIHDDKALHGSFVAGAKVVPPSVLETVDPKKTVVVCCTRDFRDQVHRHCARFPGLRVVDWDDRSIVDAQKPGRLAVSVAIARNAGLMRHAELRKVARELVKPPAHKTSYGGLEAEIRAGYDWVAQYQRDRYKALTSHIHFMCWEKIPGDCAEFGTAYGTTATFISAALSDASVGQAERRSLHLFDSFQGLPEITNPLDIAGGWKTGAYKDKTANELNAMCREFLEQDQIRIYPGWYKDTMRSIPKETKYALVHVDCDTYESTIQLLDYLFEHDHFTDGCAVLFDDWNCARFSPKLGERKAWAEMVAKHKVSYTDCGDYSVYGHKFIVHR
jgi:O-methyltransferase